MPEGACVSVCSYSLWQTCTLYNARATSDTLAVPVVNEKLEIK